MLVGSLLKKKKMAEMLLSYKRWEKVSGGRRRVQSAGPAGQPVAAAFEECFALMITLSDLRAS